MSLLIDFIDETEEVKEEYVNLIREILGKAAQMEKIEDGAELSVTFVDNERIREINRDYRDKDQPTDGHSFDRELGFLALHGFLHLLGYDHMTEEDEKEMFGRQKEILEAFGLGR